MSMLGVTLWRCAWRAWQPNLFGSSTVECFQCCRAARWYVDEKVLSAGGLYISRARFTGDLSVPVSEMVSVHVVVVTFHGN